MTLGSAWRDAQLMPRTLAWDTTSYVDEHTCNGEGLDGRAQLRIVTQLVLGPTGMVGAMAYVEALAVLGVHEVDSDRTNGPWFDGTDVLLKISDGSTVVCGLRTADYVKAHHGSHEPEWSDGYVPLPTTLDPGTVPFWDFNTLMWVGPSEHPCLAWTNAEFSLLGIRTTFDKSVGLGNILRGADGRGLPTPDQLGIEPPAAVHWQPID